MVEQLQELPLADRDDLASIARLVPLNSS